MSLAVQALQQDAASVRGELARVDAKCGLLVSLAAGGLALTVAATPALTGAAHVLRLVAGALFAIAVATVLSAVMPRIPRRGGTGFVAHARAASPTALLAELSAGDDGEAAGRLAADVWRLSRLARAKYRIIRVAVWLLIAAVAALAIALPLGQH
ncbi:Pycsar system effector family protein [Streptosporangium canum]